MKIIHTSDWHLGHTLYNHDRIDEFRHFFDQLETIVADETPDALLVSGDIFDVSSPSSTVAKMMKEELLAIRALSPSMTIIVTAGNHDSASRIDVDRQLWRVGGIHVLGGVSRNGRDYDFSENIIRVGDKGYVAAIPFVNSIYMPRPEEGGKPERRFFWEVAKALEWKNTDGLPAVLMAHLAVENSDLRGHADSMIGGIDWVSSECFGPAFDYVALGHIHKPQTFDGGRIAYSGTPVAISFDEDFPHSVNVVTIAKDQPVEARTVEITQLRPLRLFPEEAVGYKEALRKLKKLDKDDDCYIRLHIDRTDPIPADCSEECVKAVKEKKARFCTFKIEEDKQKRDAEKLPEMTVSEFTEASPTEIAKRYLSSLADINDETLEKYAAMIDEIRNDIAVENQI